MHTRRYEIQSTLTIAVRPLVASPPEGPRRILPHFYAENLPAFGQDICELHGWSARSIMESIEHEMWDAIILDAPTEAEIELLEIRLVELDKLVDKFFIVESNRTSPSSLYFNIELLN